MPTSKATWAVQGAGSEMRLVALAIGQGHPIGETSGSIRAGWWPGISGRGSVLRLALKVAHSVSGAVGCFLLCRTFKVGQLLASPNSGGYETALLLFSEIRWWN